MPALAFAGDKTEALPCSVVARTIQAGKLKLSTGLRTICALDGNNNSTIMSYEKYCSRTPGSPCKGNPTGWSDVE